GGDGDRELQGKARISIDHILPAPERLAAHVEGARRHRISRGCHIGPGHGRIFQVALPLAHRICRW
ncbi:MAG: hypothetical protein JWN45_3003, partial [Acidobacteriaceae bacterium]|nr:hypothetical protein [Acidobacteriaceae bacterium]